MTTETLIAGGLFLAGGAFTIIIVVWLQAKENRLNRELFQRTSEAFITQSKTQAQAMQRLSDSIERLSQTTNELHQKLIRSAARRGSDTQSWTLDK